MSDQPEKTVPPPTQPAAEEPPATANRGKVPSLEATQRYGGGRPRAEVDEEIERELAEAMGGLSVEGLFADPAGGRKPAAPPGPRKGRVMSLHGKDIFIDVPGGRT